MSEPTAVYRVVAAAMASAVLLLVASACGGDEPTATPTAAGPTPTAGGFAPVPPEKWDERQGGTLIFGTAKEMSSPHPWTTTSSVDKSIKRSTMLEPLSDVAKDGSLIPVLATSWVPNDDLSVWTYDLRQGVRFHNGQEMTSDDVVWSVNYIMDPDNAGRGHGDLAPIITSVEAVDRYTVRFNMNGSQPSLPLIISEIGILSIIPANSLEPGEVRVSAPPPGTGPFKFEEWVPASRTVVVRFDDYWGGKPYLEKIVFQLISSAAGRANALRTREIQIADRLTPIFAGRVQRGEIGAINVDAATLSGYRMIDFNVDTPVFGDKNVRLAAIYAMDMRKLLDEAYFGLGALVQMPVPPGSVWDEILNECCPKRLADLAKAKELLAASSYNGEPVRLLVNRGQGEPVGESLSRQLREAGFNVNLLIVESGVYDERQTVGDFDINPSGGSWGGDPVLDGGPGWRCEEGERRLRNQNRYCDPELDRLMDEYVRIADIGERQVRFREIAKRFYDAAIRKDMGWNFTRFFGWTDNVKGFEHLGNGGYTTAPAGGGLWRVYFEE